MSRENERTDLEELREAVRALPREVPPRRDLWPDLRARLEREPVAVEAPGTTGARQRLAEAPRRRPRFRKVGTWGRLAAAALLLAAVGGLLVLRGDVGSGPAAAVAELEASRAVYRQARRAVVADLEAPRTSPELAEVIAADLAVMDRAIAEVESDVRRNADDAYLRLLLADRYRREADLLRRLQRRTAGT